MTSAVCPSKTTKRISFAPKSTLCDRIKESILSDWGTEPSDTAAGSGRVRASIHERLLSYHLPEWRCASRVQRESFIKLRKEKGLAQAVHLAGPFILSFKGKP
jgi:hypothetical protein